MEVVDLFQFVDSARKTDRLERLELRPLGMQLVWRDSNEVGLEVEDHQTVPAGLGAAAPSRRRRPRSDQRHGARVTRRGQVGGRTQMELMHMTAEHGIDTHLLEGSGQVRGSRERAPAFSSKSRNILTTFSRPSGESKS
jgi:hypothetical protein